MGDNKNRQLLFRIKDINVVRKIMWFLLVYSCFHIVFSCASVLVPRKQVVFIQSQNKEPINISIGTSEQSVSTPVILKWKNRKRSKGKVSINYYYAGATGKVDVPGRIVEGFWYNFFLLGVAPVGFFWDYYTGNMRTYTSLVNVCIKCGKDGGDVNTLEYAPREGKREIIASAVSGFLALVAFMYGSFADCVPEDSRCINEAKAVWVSSIPFGYLTYYFINKSMMVNAKYRTWMADKRGQSQINNGSIVQRIELSVSKRF